MYLYNVQIIIILIIITQLTITIHCLPYVMCYALLSSEVTSSAGWLDKLNSLSNTCIILGHVHYIIYMSDRMYEKERVSHQFKTLMVFTICYF